METKCLVCGKVYDDTECPRCKFPDVNIPGADRAAALKTLQPAIDACRANFLQSVVLELVIYFWKEEDGTIVPDHEERIQLATGTELAQGAKWLPRQFARIPDVQDISVRVRITVGSDSREEQIRLPNLNTPQLQQIGVSMDPDCNIRLLLRNESDTPTQSGPLAL